MTELTIKMMRSSCNQVYVTDLIMGDPVVLWRHTKHGEYATYLGQVCTAPGRSSPRFQFNDGSVITLVTVDRVWVPREDPFECEIPL